MRLTSEELRQLYREATGRAARGGEGCPPAEALARGVAGELSEDERRLLAVHLGRCSDCALEFRLARGLGPWAESVARAGPEPKSRPRRFGFVGGPLAVAAAALLAVGLAVAAWRSFLGFEPSPSPARGVAPSLERTLPVDGAALPEPPRELAWENGELQESYEFVLYDSESTPIWKSPAIRNPRVPLPPEVRARMERGGDYYWRVFFVSGVERLQSPLLRFTVGRTR